MLSSNFKKIMRSLLSSFLCPTRLTIIFIACFLTVASCASSKGVYHTVKKGETFWRICQTYKVSTREISRVNRLKNAEKIRVGQKLYIPGRSKVRKVSKGSTVVASKSRSYKKTTKKRKARKTRVTKGRFAWPVKGRVISEFGVEGGTSLDGIDIKARKGSPVKASETGEVVHVTNDMRVFGNVIILKHKGDFYTLYAHNEKNLVKSGDKVKKGEKIAMVGSSGDADSSKLHFELRDGRDVRNPILFLP